MNEDQQGTVAQKRLIQWLVRGTKPDGTRWKSGHRHDTREAAEAEIEQWGPEMGEMKIMRITYPKGTLTANHEKSMKPEINTATAETVQQERLVRCSSCVYWQRDENRYNRAIDPEENPATGDEWASEEERKMWFPFEVRYCKHPKLLFYQRPAKDGAAVFDGSDYMAYLATGGDFGCVNGEPISSPNADEHATPRNEA